MMIQANELRIDNWVNVVYTSGLKPGQIKAKVLNDKLYLGAIQPIPLTEEILLKCGFRISADPETINYNITFDDVAFYKFTLNRKLGVNIFTYKNKKSVTQIKYLHQLQNLYFALTSEELKIQL